MFFISCWVMRKSRFLDENGAKKIYFLAIPNVLGRGTINIFMDDPRNDS